MRSTGKLGLVITNKQRTNRIGPNTDPWGAPQDSTAGHKTDIQMSASAVEIDYKTNRIIQISVKDRKFHTNPLLRTCIGEKC